MNLILDVKRFYTYIKSYIIKLRKVFESHTYYIKSLINNSIWLDDNKLFCTDSALKLISFYICTNIISHYWYNEIISTFAVEPIT